MQFSQEKNFQLVSINKITLETTNKVETRRTSWTLTMWWTKEMCLYLYLVDSISIFKFLSLDYRKKKRKKNF
jgi:hypothetical protein